MSTAQARRDLIRKMDLEAQIIRKLTTLNNEIARKTIRVFDAGGLAFDATTMQKDFEELLGDHYHRTASAFSEQLSKQLPADIAATDAELTAIDEALLVYFAARAVEQAAIITKTNQRNIEQSIVESADLRDDADKPFSRRDQAVFAGVGTLRKLKGRQQSIAITETQNAAETAKATEAEVLAGHRPSIVAASGAPANVTKEWVTVGDQDVRDSHVLADSQTRDVSKPFTVEGQLLRYPGDTSLGASAANVINCRCSAVTRPADFFAIRRRPGFAPLVETIPTEQLLESLG